MIVAKLTLLLLLLLHARINVIITHEYGLIIQNAKNKKKLYYLFRTAV